MALLTTLKTLADESRLSLLQILHSGEQTVGEAAQRVGLSEPTVSHHLARMREAGLVSLRMDGNKRFYRLNDSGLAQFKQMVATIEQPPPPPEPGREDDDSWIDALGWDPADLQVLRDYTRQGRLIRLPVKKHAQLVVLLRWIATLFEPDRLYTEPEVNAILRDVYEHDYVSLRRDMVDFGYLRRERGGGQYWVTPVDEAVTSGPRA